MSIESVSRALNIVDDQLTPIQRLVLIGIANHDGDGGAWPSKATLARYAGITEKSVRIALRALESLGYITTEINAGGSKDTPGDRRPNRYTIHFDGGASRAPPSNSTGVPPAPPRGGASDGPTGVPPAPPEPSYEPSLEPSSSNTLSGSCNGDGELVLVDVEAPPRPPSFEEFWKLYPRKVGKRAAELEWARAVKRAPAEAIIDGLQRRVVWWEQAATKPQFIVHPSTWLHQDRWNDVEALPARTGRLSLPEQARRDVARALAGEGSPGPEFGSRPLLGIKPALPTNAIEGTTQ